MWLVATTQTLALRAGEQHQKARGLSSVPSQLAEARANSLLHTGWLGQLTYSQIFSKRAFLFNQLKSPIWDLWLKYLVKK